MAPFFDKMDELLQNAVSGVSLQNRKKIEIDYPAYQACLFTLPTNSSTEALTVKLSFKKLAY